MTSAGTQMYGRCRRKARASPARRRALPPTCWRASRRRRSGCRRSISMIAPAPSCSSASPSCPSIIRRDASPASCRTARGDIAALIPAGAALIEFGSGSSTKTRIVLPKRSRLPPMCRWISRRSSCARRRKPAPGISRARDAAGGRRFQPAVRSAGAVHELPRAGFFPGSTIGNFEPHEAAAFLRHAGAHARPRRDADRRRRSGERHAGAATRL